MKRNILGINIFILYLFSDASVLKEAKNSSNLNLTCHRQDVVPELFCTLPPHPDNGRWSLLNGEGQPGVEISINSVLKYDCNVGYKLSAQTPYVVCDSNWDSSKLPTCEVLCPPIKPTSTISLKCADKNGNDISCQEATDGTYLSYTCADFYETPFGYKKTLTCLDGTWNYPNPVCQPVCGIKVNDDTIPLIFGGRVTEVLEYPWVTAVYHKKNGEYQNICGGSLISQRIILTAAHCVTNDYGELLPEENYLVGAGKIYNKYNDTRDKKAQYQKIYRMVVHSKYKGDSSRYVGDIALLVTERSFILNKWIQPVCINDVNFINLHAGNLGVISGWGVKEGGLPSDELRTLEIPYKYETTCGQELPRGWADRYNTIDKMCAGFVNKSMSICRGDSGSGLFFKNPDDNRYYVHGIASLAISHKGQCDIQQNSLYTKVGFYYQFVDRELTKYAIKDCLLPRYPANGEWIIENQDKKPGDIVPSNTILKIICKDGYHLSTGSSAIKCESSYNMPTCQVSCSKLDVPPSAVFQCKNKTGHEINCLEATDLTTLTYTCSDGFMVPHELKNVLHQCINGGWTWPTPRCVRIESSTQVIRRKPKPTQKIICVYDSWRYHLGVKPADLNASLCTHVIYDIGLSPDGNLKIRDNAQAANVTKSLYEKVTDMKNSNEKLKVILSVEGDQTEFSLMAANSSKRTTFINESIRFIQTYNFDGLDINWHYPSPTADKGNFHLLIQLLSQELKQRGWLLTATVYAGPTFLGYPDEMNRYLDWINVQTYDMYLGSEKWAGQFSPLFASSRESAWQRENLNIAESVKSWESKIHKTKIIPTFAFMGRCFTLTDPEVNDVHSPVIPSEARNVTYSEICQNYHNWTKVWDEEQMNPYKVSGNKWLGYDDKESIKLKAAYIKKEGYTGVSVWPVDGDDVFGKCGPRQILLKHVHAGLGNNVNFN